MSELSGGRFETFDANARFVVVRDDEGYGIWRLEELVEGDPIERFPDTDEGYEEAATRWKELTKQGRREWIPWLPRLKWVVIVSAILWALSAALSGVLVFQVGDISFDGGGVFDELFRWAQIVNGIAQPMTVGTFAVYVILWLEARRDR